QIQEAGVHSGDSACSLPPMTLSPETQKELERQTRLIALELKVKGLINIQFAIEKGEVFVLEVNPRASRTVPFASKAKGIPYAKIAMKVMMGKKLKDLKIPEPKMDLVYVKESVFPFTRFTGTDVILGPEMRSTGEVMGVGKTFGEAFGKSTIAAGFPLPKSGKAFLSVKDDDKEVVKNIALKLVELGFEICATRGTADALKDEDIKVSVVNKVNEGRPHVVDHIKNGEIHLVVNTSALGVHEVGAAYELRRATLVKNLCYFTTIASARAGVQAISQMRKINIETHCLQER
ncbi:MAG: ATP-grasp domain-containing protein, partial [Deltaproteobacteria bacterium]